MQIQEQAEPRAYYARAAHLIVTITRPTKMIQNGVATDIGGKDVEFLPLGDGWGRYITADPEEIKVLDRTRMVVSPEVYNDMTTPDHIKIQLAREEAGRLITQNNNLLRELEDLRAKAGKPPGVPQK